MAKPKSPIPHGTENRKKSAVPISYRVTWAERDEVEMKAKKAGLTLASFSRAMVLDNPEPRKRRPSLDHVLMGDFLGRLGKVGNNINQIARRLNEGAGPNLPEIEAAFCDLRELKNAILEALKKLE